MSMKAPARVRAQATRRTTRPRRGPPGGAGGTSVGRTRDDDNLIALAAALREMDARIRTADDPRGIPFACDAPFFRQMAMVDLTTRFGDVDVSFEPSGTGGYPDLIGRAVRIELRNGLATNIAALG